MSYSEIITVFKILKKHFPINYNQLGVNNLDTNLNCDNSFIVGKVFRIWPIQTRKSYKRTMLKIFIKAIDPNNSQDTTNLTIFLFDKVAEDGDLLKVGDYIGLTHFEIHNVPWEKEDNAYLLCLILRKPSSKLVIARNISTAETDSSLNNISQEFLIDDEEQPQNVEDESIIGSSPELTKTRNSKIQLTSSSNKEIQGGASSTQINQIDKSKDKLKVSTNKDALNTSIELKDIENTLPFGCSTTEKSTSSLNNNLNNPTNVNDKQNTPVKSIRNKYLIEKDSLSNHPQQHSISNDEEQVNSEPIIFSPTNSTTKRGSQIQTRSSSVKIAQKETPVTSSIIESQIQTQNASNKKVQAEAVLISISPTTLESQIQTRNVSSKIIQDEAFRSPTKVSLMPTRSASSSPTKRGLEIQNRNTTTKKDEDLESTILTKGSQIQTRSASKDVEAGVSTTPSKVSPIQTRASTKDVEVDLTSTSLTKKGYEIQTRNTSTKKDQNVTSTTPAKGSQIQTRGASKDVEARISTTPSKVSPIQTRRASTKDVEVDMTSTSPTKKGSEIQTRNTSAKKDQNVTSTTPAKGSQIQTRSASKAGSSTTPSEVSPIQTKCVSTKDLVVAMDFSPPTKRGSGIQIRSTSTKEVHAKISPTPTKRSQIMTRSTSNKEKQDEISITPPTKRFKSHMKNSSPKDVEASTTHTNVVPSCSTITIDESSMLDNNVQNNSTAINDQHASGMSSRKPYIYSSIKEIIGGPLKENQRYNLYAVVLKCEIKNSITNSKQIKLELTLADSTSNHLECQILGKKDETLPEINYDDIIRIHRLKVEKYRYTVYAKCFSPKDIVVFNKESLKPSSTALTRTIDEEERKKVEQMKEWFLSYFCPFKKFNEMKLGGYADVYCQVVANTLVNEDQMQVLSVWDGTTPENYDNRYFCHYKSIEQDSNLMSKLQDYLVHIWVYDLHSIEAKNIKPGQYILIRNLHYHKARNSNQSKFYLHTGSNHNRGFDILHPDNVFHQKFISEINKKFEEISAPPQTENENGESLSIIPSQFVQDSNSYLFSSMIENFVDPLSNLNLLRHIPENFKLISEISGIEFEKLINLADLLKIRKPCKKGIRALVKLKMNSDSRPVDYLFYICPNCEYYEPYEYDANQENLSNSIQAKPCPNTSCKKRRVRGKLRKYSLNLSIYFVLTLMDGVDKEVEVLVQGDHAISLLNGLTPQEALLNMDKFNEYMEILAAEGGVMDCCVSVEQENETLNYSITNTIIKST